MGLIRSAIYNIASAREDYDAQKGSHAWSLEVKVRDNRSYDDITGTYPVIGPYEAAGFILESPDGARSLCQIGTCDWYAEHASLTRGQPEITTTTTQTTVGNMKVIKASMGAKPADCTEEKLVPRAGLEPA